MSLINCVLVWPNDLPIERPRTTNSPYTDNLSLMSLMNVQQSRTIENEEEIEDEYTPILQLLEDIQEQYVITNLRSIKNSKSLTNNTKQSYINVILNGIIGTTTTSTKTTDTVILFIPEYRNYEDCVAIKNLCECAEYPVQVFDKDKPIIDAVNLLRDKGYTVVEPNE